MSIAAVSSLPTEPAAPELEGIFREHYRWVYRTAYRMTGNAEDAEDVLQTIFLRLLGRESLPDLRKNPKGYLHRAAVNVSLDILRARQRRGPTLGAEHLESAAPIADSRRREAEMNEAEENEAMDAQLRAAIAQLSPGAAHILTLRYVHNCSDAEIAKLLGTSRGTIAVSLFRSRSRLKKLIRTSLGDTI